MEEIVKKEKPSIDNTKPLITLKDVSKVYGKKAALKDVNFVINPGDRVGVIGPNGGGKSTMSEIIAGIRKPTTGTVEKQDNLVIGIQFQESKYPLGITVIDMIRYYLETFNIEMTESELIKIMRKFQIETLKGKFISSLSGGQQQRVNILLSIINNPDLVILDEVSTGLDIEVRSEIFKEIKEQIVEKNKAILLVTHMMSEIEELCDKFIYIHNGEIREAGLVKDIVKKHGSVHNYTWNKFETEKRADLEREAKEIDELASKNKKSRENKFDRIINSSTDKGKNLPLLKLIMKYYLKGGAVPFFVFVFPILLLFLEGFAFKAQPDALHSLVGSMALMQIIACGIFIIPQTILEFKNSVLMKRIGATDIKPIFFVLTINVMGIMFMLVGYLWTLLWAGLMFGFDLGWAEVAAPKYFVEMLPFFFITLVSAITFGLMLSSLFKSTTTYIAVSNVFYMPIAFLSGGFLPMSVIQSSDVLQYISYINIFKYCVDPYIAAWTGAISTTIDAGGNTIIEPFSFNTEFLIYIGVSIGLVGLYTGVTVKKLRWQA